jgi:hypothetical protein
VLNQIKTYSGRNNGAPVTGGPLGPQGSSINGHPVDSPIQPVITPPKQSHVINDAILMAARDLSKRDRTRRKIIFVISDGREIGSDASYSDTLKVLLTQNVIVYAVGVEGAAIPGYGKIQKVHIPKLDVPGVGSFNFGYGNILPKYVFILAEHCVCRKRQNDIERAYARAIGGAETSTRSPTPPSPELGHIGKSKFEYAVRTSECKDGYYRCRHLSKAGVMRITTMRWQQGSVALSVFRTADTSDLTPLPQVRDKNR